jgi:hypothetical protein
VLHGTVPQLTVATCKVTFTCVRFPGVCMYPHVITVWTTYSST